MRRMSPVIFPQSDYPTRTDVEPNLRPHTQWFLGTTFVLAVTLFLGGSVFIVFCGAAMGLQAEGINWLNILNAVLWMGVVAFGLWMAQALIKLFAVEIHAVAA